MLWCSSDPQSSVQNLKFDDFLINQEAIFRKRAVRFRISNIKKIDGAHVTLEYFNIKE